MAWRQQRDLNHRPLLHRVALQLQLQIAAHQGQRRIEVQGLQEYENYLRRVTAGVRVALDLLAEPQGCVLLEVRPGGENVGAQEAGVSVLRLVQKEHVGLIAIGAGQVVLGGDRDAGHGSALHPLQAHRQRLLRSVEGWRRCAVAQGQRVLAVAGAGHHRRRAVLSVSRRQSLCGNT
jgi:hypothetical protein